jgi:hypothetical protein
MIHHRFAKPALAVLGAVVLIAAYNSTQKNSRPQYPLTAASFQQFDSSTGSAVAPQPDSPDAAMPQSTEEGLQQEEQAAYVTQQPSSSSQAQEAAYAAQSPAYGAPQPGYSAHYAPQTSVSQGTQYSPASYSSVPSPAGGWTHLLSPDGSATVALPDSWRIAESGKGSVQMAGPGGEQIVLGYQTFVTGNQAPYMAPGQALTWFMRTHGVQLVGIQRHEAQQTRSGQAELIVAESQVQGRRYKLIARVTTAPIGMGNWMLQISSLGAPFEQFDAVYPTMQKVWNSWNLDPGYVQNALQAAANMRQQTAVMVANGAMARFNGWKPFNESWDQTIRGVTTMENQTLGKRNEVQIGNEQQYVNNCTRNGQDCRQVPINELVPQQ